MKQPSFHLGKSSLVDQRHNLRDLSKGVTDFERGTHGVTKAPKCKPAVKTYFYFFIVAMDFDSCFT